MKAGTCSIGIVRAMQQGQCRKSSSVVGSSLAPALAAALASAGAPERRGAVAAAVTRPSVARRGSVIAAVGRSISNSQPGVVRIALAPGAP